jgi:hypothetical protein
MSDARHQDDGDSGRARLLLGISFGLLLAPPLWLTLWFAARLIVGPIGFWP